MSNIFRKTKIFRGRRRRVQWIGSNFIRPTVVIQQEQAWNDLETWNDLNNWNG